jgi:hypothetical protein
MRLLHIVFIRSFKNSSLGLVRVVESELDGDVHWVFKLFNSLLHRSEVASKVRSGLLSDKRKNNSKLVEQIVDSV